MAATAMYIAVPSLFTVVPIGEQIESHGNQPCGSFQGSSM